MARLPSALVLAALLGGLTACQSKPEPGTERARNRGGDVTLTVQVPQLPDGDWTARSVGRPELVGRGHSAGGTLSATLDAAAARRAARALITCEVPPATPSRIGAQPAPSVPPMTVMTSFSGPAGVIRRQKGPVREVWLYADAPWATPGPGLRCRGRGEDERELALGGASVWDVSLRQGWNLVRHETLGQGPHASALWRSVRPSGRLPGAPVSTLPWQWVQTPVDPNAR